MTCPYSIHLQGVAMFIKRKYQLVLVSVLLASPMSLFAQAKIGLLNVMRVMAECTEGKQVLGEFQKKVEAKKVELEKKNNEIQELQKQLQSQARTLNDESRAALAKNIETKTTELQRSQDDAQKEFGAMQNEILGRLGAKIAPVVQQFSKDNNFAIVVDASNQNSQVIYFDPSIDVTDEIIKKVDASQAAAPTPVPAAVPTAPAASKPK
jgi:outer membrane protein